MKTLGIGVLGCGFVGRGAHVPAFAEIDGAELVAIADADVTRRTKTAAKYGISASYERFEQLVADPRVDAVVVALPTPLHVPASLAAIEAGKHVLCEMPLAPTLEEADRMISAARAAGVVLMPSLTFRFTANYVKVKELITAGALGNPTSVCYREFIPARDLASQWPANSWMWRMDQSGGPLYTLSVWSIDLVRWLFDTEIATADAAVRYSQLAVTGGTLGYDASVILKLANGMIGCLQYSGTVNASAGQSSLEVLGDSTQMVSAIDNTNVTLFGESPAKTVWNLKQPGPKMWGHQQQDEYFVRCLREGRSPELKPEDGRRAMEIALRIARPKL
jgi:predicted dehydrogenase